MATRKFAQIMLNNNACIYSQHIPGVSNKIADILSRRFDLSDDQLTSYICSYLSSQGTSFLQKLPSPSKNYLLDDLLAAQMQRDEGVTQNTKDKECRAWKEWLTYANSISLSHDIWLKSLTSEQQNHVFGAFATTIRWREFSKADPKCLVASTVQEAMEKLGESFRSNVGYNPAHGVGTNTLHLLLTQQFKGMRNLDLSERQQKALLVTVYWKLHW